MASTTRQTKGKKLAQILHTTFKKYNTYCAMLDLVFLKIMDGIFESEMNNSTAVFAQNLPLMLFTKLSTATTVKSSFSNSMIECEAT